MDATININLEKLRQSKKQLEEGIDLVTFTIEELERYTKEPKGTEKENPDA